MLAVELNVEGVIEKHARKKKQRRTGNKPGKALHIRRLDQRAASQQPGGETVRPDGGQVGDAPQQQQSLHATVG